MDILCLYSFIVCNPPPPIVRTMEVSYYTPSVEETDNEPCVTADGTNVCETHELVAASNCLPFNTLIQIDGMGYRVADRMNKRYGCKNIDLLTYSKREAILKGRSRQKVIIYEKKNTHQN